jgi:predicted transcriptional regulator
VIIMHELSDFFLELAHDSRLKILFVLKDGNLCLTKISRELRLSMPETSRHLSRLRAAMLIKKNTEGLYRLSDLGQIVLHLIPGYNFINQNKAYFARHSLATVPSPLLYRIGEMENSILIKDFVCAVSLIELCTQRAEKTIGVMFEQMFGSNVPTIELKVLCGVRFNYIIPNNCVLPFNFRNENNGNIGGRTMEAVKTFILITDKEAIVAFADRSGKIDYSELFHANDELSRGWCEELLNYFWSGALHNSEHA